MQHRLERIEPELIEVSERLRPLNDESVAALVESIQRIGLQTPIAVRWRDDEDGGQTPVLVAGRHRREAALRLGLDFVDCVVFDDEIEARLWEIAENLHRAELTALQRSEHIAEWVRLTVSSAQVAPVKSRRADGRGGVVGEGINAATRELHIDRTEAQRAVKIDGLSPEAKRAAREAGLEDNQRALLQAAKAAPELQEAIIRTFKPVPPSQPPRNDLEVKAAQVNALMAAWNKASREAREEFLSMIDKPVMDGRYA